MHAAVMSCPLPCPACSSCPLVACHEQSYGRPCCIVLHPQVPPTVDNVLESVLYCTEQALQLPANMLLTTHRLDVGTSGVVVLAKTPSFAAWFCKVIQNKTGQVNKVREHALAECHACCSQLQHITPGSAVACQPVSASHWPVLTQKDCWDACHAALGTVYTCTEYPSLSSGVACFIAPVWLGVPLCDMDTSACGAVDTLGVTAAAQGW